jgi:two-component sensor histidine kinase
VEIRKERSFGLEGFCPPRRTTLWEPDVAESGKTAFPGTEGAMARAVQAHDWAGTPLGPIEEWPNPLKTATDLMLASKFPCAIVWGPKLITLYNDAFRPILGNKPEALGRPFDEVWHEVWCYIEPLIEKAFAGEATFVEDYPLVIDRHGYPEQTYFTFCYSPIRDPSGRIVGMLDTVVETTAKVRAEKIAKLLNGELAHRARNLLSIITAIVEQTFRASDNKDDIRTALTKRIMALAQAQEILSQSNWSTASIRTVIRGALMPHRTGRGQISIKGPPVELSPSQSLSLALAINELATNATKYGALSTDGGRITIAWRIGTPGTDEAFHFSWIETGGPNVLPPTRRGFGTRLIEHALADDFRGAVKIDHDPAGLRCVLTTTMKNLHIMAAARRT